MADVRCLRFPPLGAAKSRTLCLVSRQNHSQNYTTAPSEVMSSTGTELWTLIHMLDRARHIPALTHPKHQTTPAAGLKLQCAGTCARLQLTDSPSARQLIGPNHYCGSALGCHMRHRTYKSPGCRSTMRLCTACPCGRTSVQRMQPGCSRR